MTKVKYTTDEIKAGVKFLSNENVSFEHDADEQRVSIYVGVGCRIWTSGDSIWSRGVVKGVKVSECGFASEHSSEHYAEEDRAKLTEEDLYWSGGLTGYANYDGSGKDGTWYDGKDDASALINRNTSKESDGLIYTDDGFVKNLQKYFSDECDFDTYLLEKYFDFSYSEQGMQQEESVNFDVDLDGDFWIKCEMEIVKFAVGEEAIA
jgi:hypothetical protein